MEINKWKNILTDWIIHTGFLQPSFSILEDSNLEAFFKAYRLKIQHAKITEDNVYAFLKQRFPHFSFHHFDDDGLCSAEFVFVYSLLLHFGCVQCRDVHIQNACKALDEFQQAAVANFFKQFGGTKYEAVTRGNLKKMIVDAMRTDVQVSEAMALSTPKKRVNGSPDTPKNRRLEQNVRELNKIRIQLETERYEKGFLEIQIKEGQQQIDRLQAQQKVHINELHELRNQLLYENDENRTPNVKDQEMRSSEMVTLKKSVSQLEDKVANLLVETHCLEADKGTLTKKLKHSEEQIQVLFERSEEVSLLVDQLRIEVNEKTQTIVELTETNEQLQMMLNEYKSVGNPLDLNSTSDFSFSKHSEADSETSGMNLAKSVVDIQLKEKQIENEKLTQQIQQIEESRKAIEAEIEEFLSNNDYALDDAPEGGNDDASPQERTEGLLDCLLKHFSSAISDMDHLKVKMDEQIATLSAQKETLDEKISHLTEVIKDKTSTLETMAEDLVKLKDVTEATNDDHRAEVEDLRQNCNALQSENDNLSADNRSYQTTIKTLEEDIFIKVNELRELNMASERVKDKYAKLLYEHDNSSRAIAELNHELGGQRKELEAMSSEFEDLKTTHSALKVRSEETEKHLKENCESLEGEIERKKKMVAELESAVQQLKENNSIIEEVTTCLNEEIQGKSLEIAQLEESLKAALESIHDLKRELEDRKQLAQEKDQEIDQLKVKIDETEHSNNALSSAKERLEELIAERDTEIVQRNAQVVEMRATIQEMAEELKIQNQKLNAQLTEIISVVEFKAKELDELKLSKAAIEDQLKEKVHQITAFEEEKKQLISNATEKDSEIGEIREAMHSFEELKREEISTLQSELTRLREEKLAIDNHNTELDEEIKESVAMIAELEEKVKFAAEEMEKMHKAETELQRVAAEKAETIQDLFKELEAATLEKEALKCDLNAAMKENDCNEEKIASLEEDLQEQTLQTEMLTQQVTEMNEDIFNKSTNITNLQAEVVNIKETIEGLGSTITGLTEELQERDAVINERVADWKVSLEEIKKLETELSSVQEEKTVLMDQLNHEKGALAAIQKRCDHLMALSQEDGQKINDLEVVRDEMTEELSSTHELLAGKENELTSVRQEFTECVTNMSKLTQEISEKSEEVTLQRVEIHDLKALSEEMDKNISELHEKLIEKTTVIVGLETKAQELHGEKVALQENLTREKQLVQKQLQDVANMQGMINMVNEQVDKFQQESATSKEALERDLNETSAQLRELQETFNEVASERNSLKETVNSLTENLLSGAKDAQKLALNLEAIKSQLASVEEEKQKMKTEKQELEQSKKELVEKAALQAEQLKKEHSKKLDTEVASFKEKISSLEENVLTLNEKISSLTHETTELKASKEALLTERDDLRRECVAEVANADAARRRPQQAQEAMDEVHVKVNRLQAQIEDTRLALAEKEDFINRNLEEMREVDLSRAHLQTQLDQATERFADEQMRMEGILNEWNDKNVKWAQRELDFIQETAAKDAEKCLLEEQLDEISKEKSQVQAALEQMQSDLEVLKTVSNQKEFHLQSELDRLHEEKQTMNQTIRELNEESVVREQRIATLTEEAENIRSLLDMKTEAHDSLVDDVEKLKSANLAQKDEINSAQQEMQTLNTLINKLTTENKVVELQLGECESKLAEINDECAAMKKRHAESVEQLQRDLEEVRVERKTLLDTNRQHERRMVELGAEIVEKERKVSLLMTDLHKNELGQMEESSKINLLLNKIESYKTDEVKLQELENLHHREKEINQKLTTDVEILCAKLTKSRNETEEMEKAWKEERRTLQTKLSTQENADERMKDYRLEMEGKLEKMKEKMKTLYNEEMGKLKNKHERDMFEMRKELTLKKQQLEEHEAQCRKFSSQIRALNERQLDMYKENEFMKNKLKMSSALSQSQRMLPPSSSMLSVANLKMEDEEGEQFNNTYLIDLKNGGPLASGRTSPSRESICLSELQHRNSMVPRHLRSTYSVQYGDQGYREEDLLHNGGLGLDDSMSSLLNTDKRKKLGGTTSYKRPGPPTPSKNGGRLSFGGTGGSVVGRLSLGGTGYDSLSQREALKEFNDNTGNRKSITKETPGKVLGSLFSNSSKVRSENATPKKRLSIFRNKK